MKILLIEDDIQICDVIKKYFRNKNSEVLFVNNGMDFLGNMAEYLGEKELVLLDIMLPDADGFTICRSIRKYSDIPVIFITARGREEDILYGYDLGCDDYIVKPVLLSALYAKCDALIRRTKGIMSDNVINCGNISLDTRKLTCFANGKEIELPPKEFAILRYLMEHKGWIVDRDTLLTRIWGIDYFGSDRVVDNHIKKLRKSLGDSGSQIKTVVGRGYKLTE